MTRKALYLAPVLALSIIAGLNVASALAIRDLDVSSAVSASALDQHERNASRFADPVAANGLDQHERNAPRFAGAVSANGLDQHERNPSRFASPTTSATGY